MIFIGIDQSLSATGVCVVNDVGRVIESKVIKTGKLRGVERLKYIVNEIEHIIVGIQDDITVVREGYSYGSRGHTFELGELGGVIDLSLYCDDSEYKISEYIVPPTVWKGFILGNGSTKKDTSYLFNVYKKTGIEFNDDNAADAYMLVHYFNAIQDIVSGDVSIDSLTAKQKECSISSKIRKKHKVTKANILKLDDNIFIDCIKESFEQYRRF